MNYTKVILTTLFASAAVTGFAQTTKLSAPLQRSVAQAQQLQQASVNVMAVLQKPVKMSDVMCRPTRGCKDQVISVEKKTQQCKGTLSKGGDRVYLPADCVAKKGYTLAFVSLKFANGKTASGGENTVSRQDDIAYVRVSTQVTQGLQGLAFDKIPQGRSLQETFGEKIESFLLSFFHSRGVRDGKRYWAMRHPGVKNIVQVGEPVIYQGKVVALVKEVPSTFRRNLFGTVPEDSLAVIRL